MDESIQVLIDRLQEEIIALGTELQVAEEQRDMAHAELEQALLQEEAIVDKVDALISRMVEIGLEQSEAQASEDALSFGREVTDLQDAIANSSSAVTTLRAQLGWA
jgi:chromosome segregation ATPase